MDPSYISDKTERRSCRRMIVGREQHAIGRVAIPCVKSNSCRRRIIVREQQYCIQHGEQEL